MTWCMPRQLADGKLYIGSWDSYFYALDTATGRQLWRFKTGEDPNIHNQVGIQSSAVVADGLVYFGCRDSNLYALDASTGEKKWAYKIKARGSSPLPSFIRAISTLPLRIPGCFTPSTPKLVPKSSA